MHDGGVRLADIPVDAARDAGALFELLKTSMEGFSIAKNNGVFTTLAPDPESLYDSPGVYSKDYLLDTWSLTHIGGEADMQTVAESDVKPTCIYESLNEMRKYL